jgi:hypothetical protein
MTCLTDRISNNFIKQLGLKFTSFSSAQRSPDPHKVVYIDTPLTINKNRKNTLVQRIIETAGSYLLLNIQLDNNCNKHAILLIFLYNELNNIDTVLIFDSNGQDINENCYRVIHNIIEQIGYPVKHLNILNTNINNTRGGGNCDATTLWFLYHIIIKKIYTENDILNLGREFEINFYDVNNNIKNPIWLNNKIKRLLKTQRSPVCSTDLSSPASIDPEWRGYGERDYRRRHTGRAVCKRKRSFTCPISSLKEALPMKSDGTNL